MLDLTKHDEIKDLDKVNPELLCMVRVAHYDVPVILVDKLETVAQDPDHTDTNWGLTEHEPRRIWIQRGTELDVYQTLLHEVLHLIDDYYGLELGETKVRVLDMTLTSLLLDNLSIVYTILGNGGTVRDHKES